jgi:hypothetical protein
MLFSREAPRTRSVTVRAWLAKYKTACPAEFPHPIRWISRPCAAPASLRDAPVVDAPPDEPIDAVDGEAPPRDAGRQDDGPSAQDVGIVEEHFTAR